MTMADCERCWALMSAALDGDCTDVDHAELNAHLAACPDCRAMWAQLNDMGGVLHDLPEPPAGLVDGIMSAVDGAEQDIPFTNLPQNRDIHAAGRASLKAWRKPILTVASLCACCLLILGVGRFTQNMFSAKSSGSAHSQNETVAAAAADQAAGSEPSDDTGGNTLALDGKTYAPTGRTLTAPPDGEAVTLPDGRSGTLADGTLYLLNEDTGLYEEWVEVD